MLSRIGRWALGLYGPAVPDALRLTETAAPERGLTQIISTVQIPAERASRLAARQQRQHDRITELQVFISEREIDEAERG